MQEFCLQDLQVLAVRMGLQAFLDLLGRKARQVRQGLQALTENVVQKGLLDPLAFLENRACRAYLFHPFQVRRDLPVQEASVLQEALDLQVSSGPLDSALQDLLDQLGLASNWQDLQALSDSGLTALQDPLEMLDQLEQAVPLFLPDLLVKELLDLSALSALSAPAAQQEISALRALLDRPDLQGQMDIV